MNDNNKSSRRIMDSKLEESRRERRLELQQMDGLVEDGSKDGSRGADKSLARPTFQCILFEGENISFDASLVIYIYIHTYIYTRTHAHTHIYIYIVLIFLQL